MDAATYKQISFIGDLWERKQMPQTIEDGSTPGIAAWHTAEDIARKRCSAGTKRQASNLITWLLTLPDKDDQS